MNVGSSKKTDMVLRFVGKNKLYEIENFINEMVTQPFLEIKNEKDMSNIFKDSVELFLNDVTEDELLDLRTYTGYSFRNINAILRNNWTYDQNGILTEENKKNFINLSEKISKVLKKFPSFPYNFMVYRGVTLSAFKSYGVENINDLFYLKGNYIYEEGFISTSVIEDSCYFNKNLDTGLNYNVKLKYLITPEYDEGALLVDNKMSYSKNQNEFLINKSSLSKVIDVEINEKLNQAVLTMVLLPRKKWDFVKDETNKVK